MTGGGSSTPRGVRIVVSGVVDRAAAGTVTDAVRASLESARRVQVDIRAVQRWEDGSLSAVAACTRLGAGIEFRVDGRRDDRSRER